MAGSTSDAFLLLLRLLVAALLIRDSSQGPHEKRLLTKLLSTYNLLERPVRDESEALNVTFGLTLQQIIDVDEKNQIMVTNVWLQVNWNDYNLAWDPADYGNITDIRIPAEKIWRPDILMYNSADETFDGTYKSNVVVYSSGDLNYVPPGMFKSTCKIDIQWFPFDEQKCPLKFGSWTYNGFQINLMLGAEAGDYSDFLANGEWDLIGVPAYRNVKQYACCPEPYVDITFTIHVQRRALFFVINLIVPCILISSMTLLGFTLPPESGEKLTLGVTILLSLTVFLLLIAETMPATSDAVPLIGIFFSCVMMLCGLSVVLTVLVLNLHHRTSLNQPLPYWVRMGINTWLAWMLRMEMPGKDGKDKPPGSNRNSAKDIELQQRSSRSLLANVLDLDDELPLKKAQASNHHVLMHNDDSAQNLMNCGIRFELNCILKEIRFITRRMRTEDDALDTAHEWRFAAAVIDRFCLWLFSIFTIVSTIGILLSAPNVRKMLGLKF